MCNVLCVVLSWSLFPSIFVSSAVAELSLGQWMDWSPWSTCTENFNCLQGTRERHRDCELQMRCLGIEAESEGCPNTSCNNEPVLLDIARADMHSFIAEECDTNVKYYGSGRYAHLMKHSLTHMFPSATKTLLQTSYFNMKITKKTLPFEQDIYRYCFEPASETMTLSEFMNRFTTGTLRFKYASLQRPLPKPTDEKYVTGFALGLQENGAPYGLYIQVKTANGFKSVYYRHSGGSYTNAYNLIWS